MHGTSEHRRVIDRDRTIMQVSVQSKAMMFVLLDFRP
jgi:hypothetical protein